MDAADQLYAASFRESYDYSQADVELQFFPRDTSFHGYVVAARLKPHFVYQVKLAGIPGSPSNEAVFGGPSCAVAALCVVFHITW